MKVRFLVRWQAYSMGEIIDPRPAVAEILVRRKLAEYVRDEVESKALDVPPHHRMRTRSKTWRK